MAQNCLPVFALYMVVVVVVAVVAPQPQNETQRHAAPVKTLVHVRARHASSSCLLLHKTARGMTIQSRNAAHSAVLAVAFVSSRATN